MLATGPSFLTCLAAAIAVRPMTTRAFTFQATSHVASGRSSSSGRGIGTTLCRRYMSTVGDEATDKGISRLSTLRTLLSRFGAPGSRGCLEPEGDLVPVEDVSVGSDELLKLHPHLYPIAKSTSSGNYVCALKRAYADDADYERSTNAPLPIVEAKVGGPGMKLLALNSEHLMRRIAAAADDSGSGDELVEIYNDGLGKGALEDSGLDTPYEAGSVAKLGYGLTKFTLLRVGPFPDLYETMALQHQAKGDEQSSLIAAEAANGKFTGFGQTFAFYARLLSTFPKRKEEARDAARMCLRLPIPSAGMEEEDFAEIARLAGLAEEGDSSAEAMAKMQLFYEKIRDHEKEDEQEQASKTPEQTAIDDANYVLDTTAFTGGQWEKTRAELASIYNSAGKIEMAKHVDPSRSFEME